MRVVLVSTEYPPHIFGGGGTFMYNLVKGLVRAGAEPYVLTSGPSDTVEHVGGARIIRIKVPGIQPRHVWFQLRASQLLKKLVGSLRPSVVHSNSFSVGLMLSGRGLGAPAVVTVHGHPRHYLHLSVASMRYGPSPGQIATYVLGYPSWDAILGRELRLSDRVVAVSDTLRDYLIRDYGITASKVVAIPNGVDVADIERKARRCGGRRRGGARLLVSGGRFFYEKGVFLIPYIMKELVAEVGDEVRLVVFGDGPMRASVERRAREMGLAESIRFVGRVPHETAICLMSAADAVLVPSLYEIMPITVLEALALKRPVIALETEYLREFRKRGAVIFSGRGVRGVARAAADVLGMVEGGGAKDVVERNYGVLRKYFEVSKTAEEYLRLYEALGYG